MLEHHVVDCVMRAARGPYNDADGHRRVAMVALVAAIRLVLTAGTENARRRRCCCYYCCCLGALTRLLQIVSCNSLWHFVEQCTWRLSLMRLHTMRQSKIEPAI